MIKNAIVRPPAATFSAGLTTVALGTPDFERTLLQHQRYCAALRYCGLRLQSLPAEAAYPDSTFVEDTAVLSPRCAVLTRPGASSRQGEVESIGAALAEHFPHCHTITAPGTVDGGDICEAGNHFFIGLSARTNPEGARQLAEILTVAGHTSSVIDIRAVPGILHLKSGMAYLGDNRLVLIDALAGHPGFVDFEQVRVADAEAYAANCLCIDEHVLIAAGFPLFQAELIRLGYRVLALEMSEFQKMDGGLSCLSLRF